MSPVNGSPPRDDVEGSCHNLEIILTKIQNVDLHFEMAVRVEANLEPRVDNAIVDVIEGVLESVAEVHLIDEVHEHPGVVHEGIGRALIGESTDQVVVCSCEGGKQSRKENLLHLYILNYYNDFDCFLINLQSQITS